MPNCPACGQAYGKLPPGARMCHMAPIKSDGWNIPCWHTVYIATDNDPNTALGMGNCAECAALQSWATWKKMVRGTLRRTRHNRFWCASCQKEKAKRDTEALHVQKVRTHSDD